MKFGTYSQNASSKICPHDFSIIFFVLSSTLSNTNRLYKWIVKTLIFQIDDILKSNTYFVISRMYLNFLQFPRTEYVQNFTEGSETFLGFLGNKVTTILKCISHFQNTTFIFFWWTLFFSTSNVNTTLFLEFKGTSILINESGER